jgi:predicted small metal-binding protein
MSMVIHCECGYVVRGGSENELVERAQAHVAESHPELEGKVSREDFLAMAEEE